MEQQFKYIYAGKEVSKEQFEILTKDAFKWFNNSSINAVDFDSVSSFFSGEYKSNNEIDKHFRGVLENHEKAENDGSLTAEEKRIWTMLNPVLKVNLKEREYPNLGDYLNKEQKVIEDFDKKEFYIAPPSKENLDKMCDSFEQRVKNDSDKCGIINKSVSECHSKIGQKHNKLKAPLDILQTRQFPKALQLLALATSYGNHKYKNTDSDFLNFKRVEGGSQTYLDASARHSTDRFGTDKESKLPHFIHAVWNQLAALQLWVEENELDIEEFSKDYMKHLQNQK